jgi:hypothetical protein
LREENMTRMRKIAEGKGMKLWHLAGEKGHWRRRTGHRGKELMHFGDNRDNIGAAESSGRVGLSG